MDEERKEEQEVKETEVLVGNIEDTNYTTNHITHTPTHKNETKGFGIAAMILGILSLVFCCFGKYTIVLAVLAIIFGIIGLKKPGKGMAITGIVTGTLGCILAIVLVVFVILTGIGLYGAVLDAVDTTQLPELSDIPYYDFAYDRYMEDYQ